MLRVFIIVVVFCFASFNANAADKVSDTTYTAIDMTTDATTDMGTETATDESQPATIQGDGVETPKTMSGMSILGNEEAPKSLVIIPWKSSELGEDLTLSDTLNDRARPVDKEVFLRELSFYEIRAGK